MNKKINWKVERIGKQRVTMLFNQAVILHKKICLIY
jgi:hypothetical protein